MFKIKLPKCTLLNWLNDQNVKCSALSTHSPHRRLQQDEWRASPGSPAWSVPWTGVSPAGAAAGWPSWGWSLRRPATDRRESGTIRLQTSENSQPKEQVHHLKGDHQIKPHSITLTHCSPSWASCWGDAAVASVEFLFGPSVSAMLTSHTIVAGEEVRV